MKMRTVGLLGLVLAHLNAPALPLVCAKAYDKVERDLSRLRDEAQSDKVTGIGLDVGAATGFAFCASRARSAVSVGACAAVFSLIGIVGFDYALDAETAIARFDDYALINKAYDYGKRGAAVAMSDYNLFFEKAQIDSEKHVAALSVLVELMDSGVLCDSQGRPNKTISEVSEMIKSRLP